MSDERGRRIAANLAVVSARIAAACATADRDPAEVTLVAVTKTFPAADVRRIAGLGVRDVGENRDQEASAKAADLADLGLTWHLVGRLQTNKARSVAGWASVVHSIDRLRLVAGLDRAARERGRPLVGLVQVSLDGDPARGGALPADVPALADAIEAADGLRLGGVMAVAPLDWDARRAYALLAEVAAAVRGRHPGATMVSAGMSGDLEAAILAGATHVRVGAALFGPRPPILAARA